MSLAVVAPDSLKGQAGINALQQLQREMAQALASANFARVRQLDATCATLLNKVCHENRNNKALLREALLDVKSVYARLLSECDRMASAKAN